MDSTRAKSRIPWLAGFLRLLVCTCCFATAVHAAEYKDSESTPPKSVEDIDTSLSNVVGEILMYRGPVTKAIDEWRKDKAPFLRDGQLNLNFRTMDFDYEIVDALDIEAWAAPGELAYRSGKWRDLLSIGASVYGSYEISGNEYAGLSGMLQPDGDGITTLGQAYIELERDGLSARLYRQVIDIAYLNKNDSRMIPNTFEAYLVGKEGKSFDFQAGYVDRVKLRNREDFISMGEAAGIENGDSGTGLLSVLWKPAIRGFDWGATYQHTPDAFQLLYSEANWLDEVFGIGVRGSAQYTYQESIGKEQLGDFRTHAAGLKLSTSYRNAVFSVAYTRVGSGNSIKSPFGGRPAYTSSMIRNFDRANEAAWRAALSYHFDELGLPHWSFNVNYTSGSDAESDRTGLPLIDTRETDFTLDFRPEEGPLQGLWFRIRYARVNERGGGEVANQVRIILNYNWSIL